jgi:steroid delta-isomerase-like uncharacterized protein
MQPLEIAEQYFSAWNSHDPAAIAGCFADGGTYTDPVVGTMPGSAVGAYAAGLWAAFPDLAFEVTSVGLAGDNLVAAQWLMRGTNHGSMQGMPPTGRTVAVPGADFITMRDGKIASVQGYFDSRAVPDQLDMAVVVQPKVIGPFTFGTATHAGTGNASKPGAFSITMIEVRSDEEAKQVGEWSQSVVTEMLGMPGFIAWVGVTIGRRHITVTAWEDAEAPKRMMRAGTHGEIMRQFFGPEISRGGYTSVWVPERINKLWNRCPECSRMADHEASGGVCACGATLPPAPAYW